MGIISVHVSNDVQIVCKLIFLKSQVDKIFILIKSSMTQKAINKEPPHLISNIQFLLTINQKMMLVEI